MAQMAAPSTTMDNKEVEPVHVKDCSSSTVTYRHTQPFSRKMVIDGNMAREKTVRRRLQARLRAGVLFCQVEGKTKSSSNKNLCHCRNRGKDLKKSNNN